MIKVLAACGAGVNSSHQIKDALETEFKNRGYDLKADAVMVKDITSDMIDNYDIFTPIAKTDLGFEPKIPVVDAGPILYRIPTMAKPVYDKIEAVIKEKGLK
ncbi:MAG: PTS fructose transporter subunit IIB [Liquorilactobacillus nagelii]|jgi:PTS system galactitol-specific IIB component|uniref:PTS fructose transporter subunit IIB n=1 Tax=Liquorilactobacillus nagelii TaxID=82688 RepID=A0A3S6R285_9LACO|nr:PTS fructose transporter subunit IIB [Liquorilactobacillus nagelii]AUJ32697.1 PTS fructose transporter subunit IIB [Liquorilactobacillus nagelii]MCC7616912.1 PTS fructose transporter subunit IIB [Liquorilactobacillus nagelii]MCI1922429.1 PTS fructose transporter subunit IIB [Liquorilactobacillus nagelii]MCI1978075.1 PTS fructose transporter subunit IIB [Liquorilactobacillus nagelii]MCP9315664.1 PTS fructose transporter subunit IIB [Liquorilactobacillus nagelii]